MRGLSGEGGPRALHACTLMLDGLPGACIIFWVPEMFAPGFAPCLHTGAPTDNRHPFRLSAFLHFVCERARKS